MYGYITQAKQCCAQLAVTTQTCAVGSSRWWSSKNNREGKWGYECKSWMSVPKQLKLQLCLQHTLMQTSLPPLLALWYPASKLCTLLHTESTALCQPRSLALHNWCYSNQCHCHHLWPFGALREGEVRHTWQTPPSIVNEYQHSDWARPRGESLVITSTTCKPHIKWTRPAHLPISVHKWETSHCAYKQHTYTKLTRSPRILSGFAMLCVSTSLHCLFYRDKHIHPSFHVTSAHSIGTMSPLVTDQVQSQQSAVSLYSTPWLPIQRPHIWNPMHIKSMN